MVRPRTPEADGPSSIRLVAANLWCWGWLLLASAASLFLAPFWFLTGRIRGWSVARTAREGTWHYARLYLRLIEPFVPLRVSGTELVRPGSPAIVAANHQSWLDLYLMSRIEDHNICVLVRAWPFRRLFFFGPLMRLADYIETEGTGAESILKQAGKELGAGAVLLGFPEGTRSRDGRLGRFHSGIFKLATELNSPVAPMIIKGSGRVMPKGSFVFRPGPIELEMGPRLDPGLFAGEAIPHGALRRQVRRRFLSALDQGRK
ncbi:MAG: 1-acyl-sn-glycerol-3-phosphate acyltransferase [Candidatus Adiutrix sp.]|jgi:1-acyl-sn-glycerol-3-phosphate acyltransferase|nr:1-acyl-sn-glycerol-3-phosphate acyltransferase [Candidatus Adiutrix sp.]